MGHFSHCCKLSGLPITDGTPVVLIVMKPRKDIYDNSEEHLRKYGSTYMCSNEGTRLKYIPCWFPIRGKYDDYGGITNIVKDDNTSILEGYYGLTIEQIMAIVTSGRKDDGFDDDLKVIKMPVKRPADQLKGESHFDYYQRIMKDPMPFDGHYPQSPNKNLQIWRDGKYISATQEQYDADFKLIHEHYARYEKWKKTNPDVEDDYGKPQYKEKYKELLTYSGMWVHGLLYDELTKPTMASPFDKLDFGTPELLLALGFVEGEKTKAERFNRPFTYGDLTVMSDGRCIDGCIYTVEKFRELAKSVGEEIDFSPIETKSQVEQIYDLLIPTYGKQEISEFAIKMVAQLGDESLKKSHAEKRPDMTFEEYKHDILLMFSESFSAGQDFRKYEILYHFLNTANYSYTNIDNPLTPLYIEHAKKGELRDNLTRFWRFDKYMYACGRYYEIVGTSPQDGEHRDVLKVLTIAKELLEEEVKEYES